MERGIRHARVLAYIDAPAEMICRCSAIRKKPIEKTVLLSMLWSDSGSRSMSLTPTTNNSAYVLPVEQESDSVKTRHP